jgi:hypothetical protein
VKLPESIAPWTTVSTGSARAEDASPKSATAIKAEMARNAAEVTALEPRSCAQSDACRASRA